MDVDAAPGPSGAGARTSSSGLEFKLHPLVLINISDHHMRSKACSGRDVRVMGCLLGSQSGRTVDISNSFEIKYTQGEAGGVAIDQAFLLKKQEQYKQVFPKLDVVGWYFTGAELTDADMVINRKIMELNESPVTMMLNPVVDPTRKDLPVGLYETEFHAGPDGSPAQVFVKATYAVETSDAERIGVDQVAKILPSGQASGSEQLTAHLMGIHSAIKMLNSRVKILRQVLAKMQTGAVPFDHSLVRKIAAVVHSLPAQGTIPSFNKDYLMEYNDALLTIYLSAITKGTAMVNELVEKLGLAYADRSSKRKGGGGGSIMAMGFV